MKNTLIAAALALTALLSTAAPAEASLALGPSATIQTALVQAGADRAALKHYDLGKENLAIGGYDPVAYFPAHGGKATKGSKKITVKHEGVLYRFASETNKKAFLADPGKFEPMYGGWCAWAMSDGKGSKTEPNPKSFTVEDGRLYLFYDGFWGDTKKSWKKKGSAPKLKASSDKNWTRISGETKRTGTSGK